MEPRRGRESYNSTRESATKTRMLVCHLQSVSGRCDMLLQMLQNNANVLQQLRGGLSAGHLWNLFCKPPLPCLLSSRPFLMYRSGACCSTQQTSDS